MDRINLTNSSKPESGKVFPSLLRIPVPERELEFSGERFTSAVQGETRHEHYHRYLFSLQFCHHKAVLDIASGEGYGAALIGSVAESIVGVDISEEAVEHANRNYWSPKVVFRCGSVVSIPLPDTSVDVVISFETIEHTLEHLQFIREIRRILRPGGILVMSSPDKDVYSAANHESNPFHLKELDQAEFKSLISGNFQHSAFLRQSSLQGSAIVPDQDGDQAWGQEGFRHLYDNFFEASSGIPSAHYLISVASDSPLPEILGSTFDDRPFQLGLYAEMQKRHIDLLNCEADLARTEAELSALRSQSTELETRNQYLASEVELLRQSAGTISELQNNVHQLAEREATLQVRGDHDAAEILELRSNGTQARQQAESLEAASLALEASRREVSIYRANSARDMAELAELRSALVQAREIAAERQRCWDVERDAFKDESATLQTELAALTAQAATTREEILTVRTYQREATYAWELKRQHLEAELKERREQAEKSHELARLTRDELSAAREKLTTSLLEQERSSRQYVAAMLLRGKMQHLRLELSSAQTTTQRFASENQRLTEELKSIRGSITWKTAARVRGLSAIVSRRDPNGHAGPTGIDIGQATQDRPLPPYPDLFDREWYLEQNADVRSQAVDPWEHFLTYGATEGRNPNPLFDCAWYLASNPDIAAAGVNPFLHFISSGGTEGRSPHPLFDSAFYLSENPDVAVAGINPLVHYMNRGAIEGRTPHPLFDPLFYVTSHSRVLGAERNPLRHYVLRGASELLDFHPFFDTRHYVRNMEEIPANPLVHFLQTDRATRPEPHPLFDTRFYLRTYPDVANQATEPFIHFVQFGSKERRNPHRLFDSDYYLKRHPDHHNAIDRPFGYYLRTGASLHHNPHPLFDTDFYICQTPAFQGSGIAPLVHFLTTGSQQGFSPHPLFDVRHYLSVRGDGQSIANPLLDYLEGGAARPSPHILFDSVFYLDWNPDVVAAGVNPLEHYVRQGAWEGRDPHPLFSSPWYLKKYPDVHDAGINPLAHWVKSGACEGRDPHPLFDTSFYIEHTPNLGNANPLAHYLQTGAAAGADPNALFRTSYYTKRNPDIARAGINPLVHFRWTGLTERRDPHPAFNCSYYIQQCPDLEKQHINPLVHYLEQGGKLRLNPVPEFDTRYYMETNPELMSWDINPLVHYLTIGRQKGRAPRPGFANALEPTVAELRLPKTRDIVRQRKAALCSPDYLYQPMISILIPVYNTPIDALQKAIESVLGQHYSNWELCIQDDGSHSEPTQRMLREYSNRDTRIRIEISSCNEGISRATNAAMRRASGEFLAFLDHDDELLPGALLQVIKKLNEDASLDVIYTDQDYINEDDSFSGDFFKPDWSPELFRGVMYVGHLLVVRRQLAVEIGGCNPRFDFVQDFEFMLRLSEVTTRIGHIPMVLYHWRRIPGSVAFGGDDKPGIEQLQEAAVNAHFARVGTGAVAISNGTAVHRLKIHPSPRSEWPTVSIVVSPSAHERLVKSCALYIEDHTDYPNFQVSVKKFDDALREAGALGDYVLFMKGDLKPTAPDWIQNLIFYAERTNVACTGPLVLRSNGEVSTSGLVIQRDGSIAPAMAGFDPGTDGYAGSLSCAREVSAISDDCILISREKLLKLGIRYEYSTDLYRLADLCLRAIAAGYSNIVNPRAVVKRHSEALDAEPADIQDKGVFREVWEPAYAAGDPYHSVNFGSSNFGKIQ